MDLRSKGCLSPIANKANRQLLDQPGSGLDRISPRWRDDLKGPYSQRLAVDIDSVVLIDDGTSVQDLYFPGSKSSNSKKERSISSGSWE